MPKKAPRGTKAANPSEDLEDLALGLAAADRRNGRGTRALAGFAWAYNRSVLHDVWNLVDLLTLTAGGPGGPLMSLWRRLAYRALPAERVGEYLHAAADAPPRYSGLLGILLVLVTWALVLFLFCWAVVTFFPPASR